MAVDVKVVHKIDKDYVKIEANASRMPTRYFKVPANKADSFCATYKKETSRNNTRNYVSMFLGVLGACGLASFFTKNLKKTAQTIIGVAAGILGVFGASFYSASKAVKNDEKMQKQHNATEIFQEKKKFPI